MAKAHRGKMVKKAGARGICPVCKRTGVKVLWEKEIDGSAARVCKRCK